MIRLSRALAVDARPWLDEPGVDGLVRKAGTLRLRIVRRDRRLEPVLVVALLELGLVVRAAAFVPRERTRGDHLGERDHVAELVHEPDRLVGPAGRVGTAGLRDARLQ